MRGPGFSKCGESSVSRPLGKRVEIPPVPEQRPPRQQESLLRPPRAMRGPSTTTRFTSWPGRLASVDAATSPGQEVETRRLYLVRGGKDAYVGPTPDCRGETTAPASRVVRRTLTVLRPAMSGSRCSCRHEWAPLPTARVPLFREKPLHQGDGCRPANSDRSWARRHRRQHESRIRNGLYEGAIGTVHHRGKDR